MIPYLPSLQWWIERVSAQRRADTLIYKEEESPEQNREMMRCRIRGGQMLTVPICGGTSTLKRIDPREWKISEHGRWPEVHIGALSAVYGTAPYYPHYMPRIEAMIRNHPERAEEFTMGLCKEIEEMLDIEALMPAMWKKMRENPEQTRKIKRDILDKSDIQLSILDALFRLGPATIFALCK